MRRSPRWTWVVTGAVCLGLPACASASREAAAPRDAASGSADTTQVEVEASPLASDPYVRRPHGLGGSGNDARDVRFLRPERVEANGPRPAFVGPVSVGVVLVSAGLLANPATLVLELEANLARDEGVRRVVALRGLSGEVLSLEDLRLLAAKQGHDALLIDVLPGPEGSVREGFWLHPGAKPDVALIAHVVVTDAEAGFVGTPTFPDVWDRLASAHWRLPVPQR